MFGIKTKLKKWASCLTTRKFSNDDRIYELMKFFKAEEYGHQCSWHQADLGYGWWHYGFVRQQKPKKVLCIGSRYGYIPAVLAQACFDNGFGKVDFIDAGFSEDDEGGWTGVGYWRTKEGQNSFVKFGLGEYIKLFLMTTKDFAKRYSMRKYDYIYIDGDHSYQGVSLDVKLFWPKLKKHGLMVFHDVGVKGVKSEGEYGVWEKWQELKKEYGGIEIKFKGSGLGVIQKG